MVGTWIASSHFHPNSRNLIWPRKQREREIFANNNTRENTILTEEKIFVTKKVFDFCLWKKMVFLCKIFIETKEVERWNRMACKLQFICAKSGKVVGNYGWTAPVRSKYLLTIYFDFLISFVFCLHFLSSTPNHLYISIPNRYYFFLQLYLSIFNYRVSIFMEIKND